MTQNRSALIARILIVAYDLTLSFCKNLDLTLEVCFD